MSVKQGLLALLAEGATYGARLRSEFEARTGGTWPLNIGQVYTTLARLERDGLVEPVGGTDDEGRITYRLTEQGRVAAEAWWRTPVARDETPRDELVIKLALAVTSPGVDVAQVVQTQRTATLKHLRDLTRLKASGSDEPRGADLAWQLVLENLLFSGEAEIRWLDHVESTLARHARMPLTSPPASPESSDVAEPRSSERKGARA
ncbi:MAG: PadR family transcriptional regulator [Intrasporangium sp.]|uniref:PadR family transcriptional regulator n=1 Tax=Intrasporangium sp. TaxID=1925024 RepID=UPI003F8176F8